MSKTVLITGASSGIGLELAKIFARESYDLIITARREDRLLELKKELQTKYNTQVWVISGDLAESNTVDDIFSFVTEQKIDINALINNAGVGDYGMFIDSDWQRQNTMIQLNITALTKLTHLFLPMLSKQDRAYVMNIASNAAFQPGPLMSVYYASKHYVLAFSEAIANELNGTGITVTTLCPGPTHSEFVEKANMQKSKLFDRFPVPDSKEVAEYGYKAMIKGKRVAVHGLPNKISSSIVGLFPRNLVTAVVRKIQERK